MGDEVAADISSSVGALPVATEAIIVDICLLVLGKECLGLL